jgi:hypothetical protein
MEQFYQMPNAFDGASIDGDSVIRVELPASALASLGLQSSPDAASDASDEDTQMVSADVVVAEDGSLEAIRLAPEQQHTNNP